MSLPTRWIICTKWSIPKNVPRPPVPVAGPVSAGVPAVPAEPTKPEFTNLWTPLGSPEIYKKRGKVAGIPKSFDTADAAILGLQEVGNQQPELIAQDLNFVILEVRYIPNKIKVYKQDWFDKYVKKEIALELKDHKFTDVIK